VNPVIEYFSGVRSELAQVSWPSRETVVRLTLIVLIVSAIVGVYVGAVDFGFTKLLGLLIK
jgi:preprotein translocase subunit SecE